MIKIFELWKNRKINYISKRTIQEVKIDEINLKEYILLDIRNRREYREGHLKYSINIPLYELKRNVEKFIRDKDKKILVYCQSGIRSKKAVEIIENLGYKNVYNLKGGLENI